MFGRHDALVPGGYTNSMEKQQTLRGSPISFAMGHIYVMSNLVSNHTCTLEEFMSLLYPKVCFLSREKFLVS